MLTFCSSFVQGRVQICNDLKQRKLGDEAIKGQEEIRNVHKARRNPFRPHIRH